MNAFNDLTVPREDVSRLLEALGFHLDTTLAPAMVLAATDVLLAAELAQALPPDADFIAAVRELTSFARAMDEPVALAAQAVYQQIADQANGLTKQRLAAFGELVGL